MGENGEEENGTGLAVVKMVEGKGRGVVAMGPIRQGTLVMKETGVAVSPLGRYLCAHCLGSLGVGRVKCGACSKTTYCCPECKEAAWDHIHWMECGTGEEVVGATGDLFNLSLRLFLATPPEFRGLWEAACPPDVKRPQDIDLRSFIHQPQLRWTLLSSLPQHKKEMREMEGYKAIVDSLSICAQAMVASGRAKSLRKTRRQLKCAMRVVYCNTFHIYESEEADAWGIRSEREAGCGIYCAASLFNHSCLPNMTRTFSGTRMYLRAIKDIEAGEELVITYGVSVKSESTFTRRRAMENWYFRCACTEACGNREWRRREAVHWGFACPSCLLGPAIAEKKEDLTWLHRLPTPPKEDVRIRCLDCGTASSLSPQALAGVKSGMSVVLGGASYRSDLSALLRPLHPDNHIRLLGAWTTALSGCFSQRILDVPALDALTAVHSSIGLLHHRFHLDVARDAATALKLLNAFPPTPESRAHHSALAQQLLEEMTAILSAHYGPHYLPPHSRIPDSLPPDYSISPSPIYS